jgi:hypothetical protein
MALLDYARHAFNNIDIDFKAHARSKYHKEFNSDDHDVRLSMPL